MCVGMNGDTLKPGERSASTSNRNFRGRMGTKESDVYLASPLVVAASAVAGHARRHIESLGLGTSDFAVLEALYHKGSLPVNAIGLVRLRSPGSEDSSTADRIADR